MSFGRAAARTGRTPVSIFVHSNGLSPTATSGCGHSQRESGPSPVILFFCGKCGNATALLCFFGVLADGDRRYRRSRPWSAERARQTQVGPITFDCCIYTNIDGRALHAAWFHRQLPPPHLACLQFAYRHLCASTGRRPSTATARLHNCAASAVQLAPAGCCARACRAERGHRRKAMADGRPVATKSRPPPSAVTAAVASAVAAAVAGAVADVSP